MINRILVCDTETTGLHPEDADIISVAFVVLDTAFQRCKNINPFYMMMKPVAFVDTPEYKAKISKALQINKIPFETIMKSLDSDTVADRFGEWFKQIGDKKVELLCQNYPFDSGFLKKWLSKPMFDFYFHYHYHDTIPIANYLNTQAEVLGYVKPFPDGVSLSKLCKAFKIENMKAHDALGDCVATAEVYRAMLDYLPVSKKASRD